MFLTHRFYPIQEARKCQGKPPTPNPVLSRAGGQAIGVGVVLWLLGFWLFRQWLRSAPRSARRTRAVAPSRGRELIEVQDENARLHAEAMNREAE